MIPGVLLTIFAQQFRQRLRGLQIRHAGGDIGQLCQHLLRQASILTRAFDLGNHIPLTLGCLDLLFHVPVVDGREFAAHISAR